MENKLKVAVFNNLHLLGGPISYTRCIYKTLQMSERVEPELYVYKSKYKLTEGCHDTSKLSIQETADLLNSTADIVWMTFTSQMKRHTFKNEPPPSMQILSLLKIPFVMTIHRDDEITNHRTRGASYWEWQQWGLKNLAGIVVISEQLERKVKELKLIDDSKIFRTHLVYPDPPRDSDHRKNRITSLSRFAQDKRQEKVAELADYLPDDIEVNIYGKANLFNHDIYQPWIDKGRCVWPGEFYPTDVWNILSDTLIGADFDAQAIGDKLQGVTLEFMLSGVVPLVVDDREETRWPTLKQDINCIKIWEDELLTPEGMDCASHRIQFYINASIHINTIRQNNYEFVKQFQPDAVLPILEDMLLRAYIGANNGN